MARERVAAVVSLGLLAWAGYLMYDMNEPKKTDEFKRRFESQESASVEKK